jgi:hypothetical protein
MNINDIEVDSSGYRNTQVVEGYMYISVPGVFEELHIDVEEVSSHHNHDVYMYFDFDGLNDDVEGDKIVAFFGGSIEYDKDKGVWLIVDDDIVADLFSQYGNNDYNG